MSPERAAYLAVCAMLFLTGIGLAALGRFIDRATRLDQLAWFLTALGLLCTLTAPLMLIGLP